jgi:glycosyltransferase involved in cell wall biosynthesis
MIYHESDMFIPYEEQQLLLDAVDAQIYLAPGELERVKRHLKVDESKVHFVPNGIDEHWFEPQSIDPSVEPYVLTVGRIEPHKGQLATAKACKELKIKYVCIGERTDGEYARLCEKHGAELLPPTNKPEELKRFYASCKVFALASRAEVMPLTIMEAGAQQANIVVGDHCEWKDIPNAVWCKFDDVESIKGAITIALLKPKNKELQDKLRGMTWKKVGEQLNKIYESLIVG